MAWPTLTARASTARIAANPYLAGLATGSGGAAFGGTAFVKWDASTITVELQWADWDGAWADPLAAAILTVLDDIEAICDLRFVQGTGGDIVFHAYSEDDGIAGYSYGVGGRGVWINANYLYDTAGDGIDGLVRGGFNYRTVVHETLHNLGLAHPHDGFATFPGVSGSGDPGLHALNQNLYTVMSYNRVRQVDADGHPTTGWPWSMGSVDRSFGVMGAFDIAMLQELYGANMKTATGNDCYRLPDANLPGTGFACIWDAGGTDTLVHGRPGDSVIDLRPATLDPADGMLAGGALSSVEGVHGGYTIAAGVVIENARGGAGRDRITGNEAANRLEGRAGKDHIRGGDGDDTLMGNRKADKLVGQGGDDVIVGGRGNDRIRGGGGDDRIEAGDGRDKLIGGAGADVFVFDDDDGSDRILDFQDGVDRIRILDADGFDALEITRRGDDLLIVHGDTQILVEHMAPGTLTEDDFLFGPG